MSHRGETDCMVFNYLKMLIIPTSIQNSGRRSSAINWKTTWVTGSWLMSNNRHSKSTHYSDYLEGFLWDICCQQWFKVNWGICLTKGRLSPSNLYWCKKKISRDLLHCCWPWWSGLMTPCAAQVYRRCFLRAELGWGWLGRADCRL